MLVYVLIGAAGIVAASYFLAACLRCPALFLVVAGFSALCLLH
jgi:hypothetical protein